MHMNTLKRRQFISQLSLATAALSFPYNAFSFSKRMEEFVEVEITYGKIRGVRSDGVNLFKGTSG